MITVSVRCDGCGCIGRSKMPFVPEPAIPAEVEIRTSLEEWGWLVDVLGGLDYCPRCADRVKSKIRIGG